MTYLIKFICLEIPNISTGLSPISFLSLSGMENNGAPLHLLADMPIVTVFENSQE